MNSFYEHHKDSINWHYRCFDRILLNGLIQPFQQPERVVGFFNTYRQLYPVTRETLRGIADQFQRWVTERAEKRNISIVEAPKGRRDEFIDPYFERAKPDAVVAILKAREPARIMIAIGDKVANRWHLQFAQRWVIQYNFYINDRNWGRMFVRVCPYLPFSARICLNQHHWLANRMRQHGIITSTGKRIPGLKLDHPRQLALMHALVRFAHVAADNTFTTAEIYPAVIKALGCVPDSYTLASLRYDLSKLRAKGLVAKLPNSRRYQLLPQGYSICLIFLKLFERVYAPLMAGLLSPFKADKRLESQRRSQLDRLYQRVIDDLDTLVQAVGLKAA